jgi:predicted amino acid racemase
VALKEAAVYPRVDIQVEGVLANFAAIRAAAEARGVALSLVTKALAGYQPLVERLIEAGATSLGEAHVHTLRKYDGLPVEKWMIRLPLISQAYDVVRHTDVSLNTELATIRALGAAAEDQSKRHKVVIMVESGDRREGVLPDRVVEVCVETSRVPGIELHGLGTEFGCVSDVVPSPDAMDQFARLVDEVETALGRTLPVISGGSSNGLGLLIDGQMPPRINHLRVGETILTGKIANFGTPLPGGSVSPFTLSAEIIEVVDKPSLPSGPRAPGQTPVDADPHFPDRGVRRRALVAVGKQDVGIHSLSPHDPAILIEEGSSDVFVADITDSATTYEVGDILTFAMDYFAILPAMVSEFVEKRLV